MKWSYWDSPWGGLLHRLWCFLLPVSLIAWSTVSVAVQISPGNAYSVQMHVHGPFSEGTASISSATNEARNIGLDILWWSDHDFMLSRYHDITTSLFEGDPESINAGEDWVPNNGILASKTKYWSLTLSSDVDSYSGEISDERAYEGSKSFRVQATSSTTRFRPLNYEFRSNLNRVRSHPLVAQDTMHIAIYPEQMGIDARAMVDVFMSRHGMQNAKRLILHYYLDNEPLAAPFREGSIYNVPLTYVPNEWNYYELPVTEDAIAGFPEHIGEDNNSRNIRIGVETRLGATGVAFFDEFRIVSLLDHPHIYQRQGELLDLVESMKPEVTQLQGVEISQFKPHLNEFSLNAELPDYDQLALEGGFADPVTGWIDQYDEYGKYVTSRIVEIAHERGGLVSLNHAFGTQSSGTSNEDPGVTRDLLIAKNAYGADLLEVGYRNRGYQDLQTHLWLWDEMIRAGIYMTGTGISDSHDMQPGSMTNNPNNFVSWIYASSPTKADLLDGMKRGRIFFGDLILFDGTVDLATSSGHIMGQIVLTDRGEVTVGMHMDGLAVNDEVRVILNGNVYQTYTANQALFEAEIDVPLNGHDWLRVEAYRADGEAKVFSNPIHFTQSVPSGGLDSWKGAIDLTGIQTTKLENLTLSSVNIAPNGAGSSLDMEISATGGTITLDYSAHGTPTDVVFQNVSGEWSLDENDMLTISSLSGDGTITIIVNVQHFADGDLAPWDNPDGLINAADVLIATQLVLGLRLNPGPLQYAHGDMNIDGVIDLADLILIQQTVLQQVGILIQ
ncbi:MAG: CehA/McbA family metallohydrolase [Pseudomonadota bacterium]